MDVAQAFDNVWHEELMNKLEKILPTNYTHILKSYNMYQVFYARQKETFSTVKYINASVPSSSMLKPLSYLLYPSDIP